MELPPYSQRCSMISPFVHYMRRNLAQPCAECRITYEGAIPLRWGHIRTRPLRRHAGPSAARAAAVVGGSFIQRGEIWRRRSTIGFDGRRGSNRAVGGCVQSRRGLTRGHVAIRLRFIGSSVVGHEAGLRTTAEVGEEGHGCGEVSPID